MTILFVDHEDSFSNNLVSWFQIKQKSVEIVSSQKLSKQHMKKKYQAVIFSPGPGHPSQYPKSINFYKNLPENIPFLGVCLGHQILLFAEGVKILQICKTPLHGRQVFIKKTFPSKYFQTHHFKGTYVLYNSLGCKIQDPMFLKNFHLLASENDLCLMTEHKIFPRIGVQFHPESFASPNGYAILNEFLGLILC
jgi:anthranilate/para-aminobenzoate synthase component II